MMQYAKEQGISDTDATNIIITRMHKVMSGSLDPIRAMDEGIAGIRTLRGQQITDLGSPGQSPGQDPKLPQIDTKKLEYTIEAIPESFPDARAKVLSEFQKIVEILNDILKTSGPLKQLENELFNIIDLTTRLRFLEVPIQDVKLDKNEQISVKYSWILEPVKDELKEVHKLSTTPKIHEIVKKNYDLSKIYKAATELADNDVMDIALKVINNFKDISNIDSPNKALYIKLEDQNNLNKFLKIIKEKFPPTGDRGKNKTACDIFNAIKIFAGNPYSSDSGSKYKSWDYYYSNEYKCFEKEKTKEDIEKERQRAQQQGKPPQQGQYKPWY
jgi:hypothetical protein